MTDETARYAVLYPAVAEAAHRAGAAAVGLIDVGHAAAPDLARVGITYDGQTLGDPDAPEQVACSLRGGRRVPQRAIPELVARIGVDALAGDAIARVPADALPVVITTWVLSKLSLEDRLRFLHRLDEAASGRTVAWVSAEGVGVAPAIPTLGDRRASGHSIVGVAVFDGASLRAEAVGRCWSRGRYLAWLAPLAEDALHRS